MLNVRLDTILMYTLVLEWMRIVLSLIIQRIHVGHVYRHIVLKEVYVFDEKTFKYLYYYYKL